MFGKKRTKKIKNKKQTKTKKKKREKKAFLLTHPIFPNDFQKAV